MGDSGETLGHRRPIRARNLAISGSTARALARGGVSPNAISILGMLAAVVAGACLALTGLQPAYHRPLFFAAAVLMQLRLIANLLDGMVAVENNKQSVVGEIYNDLPDRISDVAALVGAGYAIGSVPELGYIASILAVFVTYIRVLGRSLGTGSDFRGPMAKQHRMAVLTGVCVFMGATPLTWQGEIPALRLNPLGVSLAIIILGCLITSWRRLAAIVSTLRQTPRQPSGHA